MPNRIPKSCLRHNNRVIEARAGLIPACDDVADEMHARMSARARVLQSVKSYARAVTNGSESQAVIDILTNLRHCCDCKGLKFHTLNEAANEFYLQELDGLE